MRRCTRLFHTTAFRLSLIYFGLFAITAAIASSYLYYKTNVLLAAELEDTVQAEIRSLAQRYRNDGLAGLTRAVVERSETPGNSLYLLADAEGRYLGGNLKAVSSELWNSEGRVAFFYRRAHAEQSEDRFAFAVIFRLASGYRLVVGRDIEDQRRFGDMVRSAFLWTLAGLAMVGLGGSILIGRGLLQRLEAMTDATGRIMAGDLSERIPVAGARDEFDRMAAGINAMLGRIEELIAGFKEVSDNIAHDLKTPLNRLRSRAETALRERGDVKSLQDALQSVIEDADELIKTFEALLSIARLEAGTDQRQKERFDLAAVVTDVFELYEPVAEERGLSITLDAGEETILEGKRELIAQAVANLLDNAIKYGGREGPGVSDNGIELSLTAKNGHAEIVVADRGPGVPAEDRERVFKRFVRLEASRSQPGSGLGLSLVAAVTRLHGGTLTLSDNAPGLKATLSLPLKEARRHAR
ncbi:MAG: HAMP domain-containing histidine kinase [Rhodomicrobium sp.]|nr:HAMP domain-containing histidine kinase [Rhodomicrobium sp.]